MAKDRQDILPSRRDTATWRFDVQREPTELRRNYRGESLPFAAGWLTGAVGILNLLSALTDDVPSRLDAVSAYTGIEVPAIASSLALPGGVALLVLAPYLARRRRRALRLCVTFLVALGALNLLKGLDIEEAVVSWSLAGLLWWGREAFYVRHAEFGVKSAIRNLIPPLFTAAVVGVVAATTELWATTNLMVVLSFFVALGVARVAFSPLATPSEPRQEERQAAVDLVRSSGSDTLSVFQLREDLLHFIASDQRALWSYRVNSRVMLCSGDPVGPDDAIPGLLREVFAFAEERGLRVGVVGAGERLRALGRDAGLHSIYMGDEALVDTREFSLEGRPIRKVRQSVNRLAKAGYTAELLTLAEVSDAELEELETVAHRGLQGRPERGFSMAMDGLRGSHLSDSWVLIARDVDLAIRGFLHFVPSYGSPSASLSAMRRDWDTPNGLTEFMVVRAIQDLGALEVFHLSLNFAVFGRLLRDPQSNVERVLGRIVAVGDRYFQIESLYTFNAKFFPRWQPRYILYEGKLRLPRVALATMLIEGHLPSPSLRQSTLRRQA